MGHNLGRWPASLSAQPLTGLQAKIFESGRFKKNSPPSEILYGILQLMHAVKYDDTFRTVASQMSRKYVTKTSGHLLHDVEICQELTLFGNEAPRKTYPALRGFKFRN